MVGPGQGQARGQEGRGDRPGEGAGRGNLAENQERQAERREMRELAQRQEQGRDPLTPAEESRLAELRATLPPDNGEDAGDEQNTPPTSEAGAASGGTGEQPPATPPSA